MYRRAFTHDLFTDLERLQRVMQEAFESPPDLTPSIRGYTRGGFPALNVGHTPQAVEVYAFLPGVAPDSVDVQIEKGLLSIAGERAPTGNGQGEKSTAHIEERFAGRFRRVISLPDDIDANAVQASCRDGVLHVTIPRQAAAQPRRITIQ